MYQDSDSIIKRIKELIAIAQRNKDSINPEREALLNRQKEVFNSLGKIIQEKTSSQNKKLRDEYFKISKELNDPKQISIMETINRTYKEIFELKSQLESLEDYSKGYLDGLDKAETDFLKNEILIMKKEDKSSEDESNKTPINNALWAIAGKMRARKDDGEFATYREAYRWAEKNYQKENVIITAHKLEREYHRAISAGKFDEKKSNTASIPFMITIGMRKRLNELGYRDDQIRNMRPKQAWDIIKKY